MDMRKLVGRNFARLRLAKGFTQERFAEHSGFTQQYVSGLPEAKSVSICPIWGLSTRDEARDAVACLKRAGGSSVLLVTSDFHTRRALNIFRHEVRGYTFHVAAAFDENEFGTYWWKQREWAKTAVSEWAKFFWWEAVDRWRASVPPSHN